MTSKIQFPEFTIVVHQGKDNMDVSKAKALSGWEVIGKDDNRTPLFRDLEGNRIVLTNNPTNRPFRIGLAKRYANEMLRKKWALNGESIIGDRLGHIQSGQHRLVGLVLAEQMRCKNKAGFKAQYGWSGPVNVPMTVAMGISEKPECVDTLDIGQKRSLGDVVFRNHVWEGYSEKEQKKLSNVLSGAARLVWLRVGGKTVSDAPHFPHSEALDFIDAHPGIRESVEFIFNEEGGSGADGKKVTTFLTLGYSAALHYLMSTVKTDPTKYADTGKVDTKAKDKADDFWTKFAAGADVGVLKALARMLVRIDASGAMGRDEVCGTVIKAFNLWMDGKDGTGKDIKVKRGKNDLGKVVLAETPRLGGLDTEVLAPEEDPEVEEAPAAPVKGSKAGKSWAKGDTCWVKDPDDSFFSTVTEVYNTSDGDVAKVTDEDGNSWEVKVSQLVVNKPKA